MKTRQITFFPQGLDSPLFSGTPQRGRVEVYEPTPAPPKQSRFHLPAAPPKVIDLKEYNKLPSNIDLVEYRLHDASLEEVYKQFAGTYHQLPVDVYRLRPFQIFISVHPFTGESTDESI